MDIRREYMEPGIKPDPVIEYYKQFVDRTLLRENLKLTPDQRLQKLQEMVRFAEECREAGKKLK